MPENQQASRIGVLWRGDRRADRQLPRADCGLGPLFEAFASLPVIIEPVAYCDDAVDEVEEQLLTLDGVLVWVNPIQDGANRARLDALLRAVSSQGRGNGGNGVWKVELPGGKPGPARVDTVVRVQDARSQDGSSEHLTLGSLMARCEGYLAWSGCLVDQAYQDRLADGMLRCYFSHDHVVGFCHQWPKGLLDDDPHQGMARASLMEGPDVKAYQALRVKAEAEWVPQMTRILGIGPHELPVIWDADFLYGPKTVSDSDTYVLCEINASAVWPFPPMAAPTVAAAALACTQAATALRS